MLCSEEAVALLSLSDVSASLFSILDAFSLSRFSLTTPDFFTIALTDVTGIGTGADTAGAALARPLLLRGTKYLGN